MHLPQAQQSLFVTDMHLGQTERRVHSCFTLSRQSLKDLRATKIVQIRIQSKVADEVSPSALSAIVTKKDGSTESLIPSGDWGSTVEEN